MSIGSEMTPADIAAVTRSNGGAWGGDFSSWIIIFLIFAMFGWGGRGYGGYGGNESGGSGAVVDNYVLSSDFGQVERKLDGIANGICDSTYALNNAITNGFAAAQNTMTQGFAGLNTGLVTQGYETRNAIQNSQVIAMQNANALQAQLAQCCCDNKAAIADVKYSMAMNNNATINAVQTGFCQTNFNNQSNTRDIIESQNAGTRAILDALNAQRIEAKDAKIAEQASQIQALNLAASQCSQNAYLINQLRPQPNPAYVVPNPYCNCGCNNGCGC